MNLDDFPPPEVMWAGNYVRGLKRDKWEYASRTDSINAVVIIAEYEGKVILVDQPRVPTGCRCIQLPAGLVGERTRRNAEKHRDQGARGGDRLHCRADQRLGEFYASPGMLSESFTLVRAHGVRKIGEGGGDENEDISVHLVARAEIPNFIEQKRAEGFGVDVKLLLFLNTERGHARRRRSMHGHAPARASFRPAFRRA